MNVTHVDAEVAESDVGCRQLGSDGRAIEKLVTWSPGRGGGCMNLKGGDSIETLILEGQLLAGGTSVCPAKLGSWEPC